MTMNQDPSILSSNPEQLNFDFFITPQLLWTNKVDDNSSVFTKYWCQRGSNQC